MAIFNTESGLPIFLDNDNKKPDFYIYPCDVTFMEKAHQLYFDMQTYEEISKEKMKQINLETDENGILKNFAEYIECVKTDFAYILKSIDNLLGEGVSEKIFKGRFDEELLNRFLSFIFEEIDKNRKNNISKYQKQKKENIL